MKRQISELEKAYFAGFFDGEGCVELRRVHTSYGIAAATNIAYVPTLELLRDIFGGSIHVLKKREHCKQVYGWGIMGKSAYEFLTAILPYLHEKRSQVELIVQYHGEIGLGVVGKHRHSGEKGRQEWYYRELKRLKTLEYAPGSVPDAPYSARPTEQLRLIE